MFKPWFWLLIFVMLSASGQAQGGFTIRPGLKQVDVPFEYNNNFIILTLNFNGRLPLKFIFDTGAEHTILTKREIGDLFGIAYEREFRVTGSDMKTELIAYLARRIHFDLGDKLTAPREDILVLKEDYFRFEEYAGVQVHGILSANVFSKYIIQINYQRHILTLYERESFSPEKAGFTPVPVEIFRNKIYLNTLMQIRPDTAANVKLLVDTGAGLPLLLFTNTHPLLHPPANALTSNIGMGLGGFLQGYTGRVHGMALGTFAQGNIVTYFQDLDTTVRRDYLNQRNGLIGNMLLNRFIVIIDYQKARIWIKPSRTYRLAYVYDRSGLSIIASGTALNHFTVQGVLPNSPAAEAGMLTGDQITRIGVTPSSFYSLSEVQRVLQKKVGKRIKLVVRRDGKRMKKTLVLRDLI